MGNFTYDSVMLLLIIVIIKINYIHTCCNFSRNFYVINVIIMFQIYLMLVKSQIIQDFKSNNIVTSIEDNSNKGVIASLIFSPLSKNERKGTHTDIQRILHECSLHIVFMKRVYCNDMKRALASFIFIIVNEFHKNDM